MTNRLVIRSGGNCKNCKILNVWLKQSFYINTWSCSNTHQCPLHLILLQLIQLIHLILLQLILLQCLAHFTWSSYNTYHYAHSFRVMENSRLVWEQSPTAAPSSSYTQQHTNSSINPRRLFLLSPDICILLLHYLLMGNHTQCKKKLLQLGTVCTRPKVAYTTLVWTPSVEQARLTTGWGLTQLPVTKALVGKSIKITIFMESRICLNHFPA